MFKFFNKKGVLVYSSDSITDVETEAIKYKTDNNLNLVEILRGKGNFYKFV